MEGWAGIANLGVVEVVVGLKLFVGLGWVETKWKGFNNKEVNGYKLWYSGSHTARNGVGVILRACLKDKVVHVNRCSDRIISLTLVIEGETINVISAYAPQVGATTERYSGVHGGFGYGVRNEEGRSILDFATAHDLAVVNSYFKKKDHHLITFQSGGRCTQINYLLVRQGDLKACKDCKVFPGEACSSQHRLLAMDTLFRGSMSPPRCRSAATRESSTQILCGISLLVSSPPRDAAKDSFGEALGSSKTHTARRESWWLCEEVQSKVAEKQARFRELLSCQEAQAKEKAYEDLYKKLDSKEGSNEIFRIAKARQRRRRDLGDICFIKDEGVRIVTDEEKIKQRWGEYFSSLFNTGEPEGHEGVVDQNTQHALSTATTQGLGIKHLSTTYELLGESGFEEVAKKDLRVREPGSELAILFALILDDRLFKRDPGGHPMREALEANGLRVSREKTEYLRCDFSNSEIAHNEEVEVCIGDKILQPKESFRYLRSMLHKSGRIDKDVAHRIKAAWLKWRDWQQECWPITKALANRMEVAELRMLRWTCGKTMLDMIPNGVYRAELEVETIINKMREGRLRWFGHVRRRPQSAPVRRVEALVVDGMRRRGRPKLRWEDRVKLDMKELLLSEDMTSDRNEWRARTSLGG
ncbi:ataxia telangiectasia mutated family protein [Tanacetum coccineum]